MNRRLMQPWQGRLMTGLALLIATGSVSAQFPDSMLANPGSLLQRQRAEPDLFASLAVIEPLAMDEMRGGFSIGGVNLSFGATARTMIDGVMLQTVFRVNESGSQIVSQQFTTGMQDSGAASTTTGTGAPSVPLAIQDFLSRFSVPVSISAQTGGASAAAPSAQANGSGASANAGGGVSASAQGSGSSGSPGGRPVLAAAPVVDLGSVSGPEPTPAPSAATTSRGGGANVGNGSATSTVITNTVIDAAAANVTGAAVASSPADQSPAASTQAVSTAPASSSTVVLVGPDNGTSVTQVTPADVDLSGVADYSGIVIKDAQGFTAALHQLTQDAVRSAVISNKSGQQIRNELNIEIKVQNLRDAAAANLRSSIVDSVQRRIGQ